MTDKVTVEEAVKKAVHDYGNPPEPKPPGRHVRTAGHHWLEVMDLDGHSFGIVVVQWNPGAERWSHSGNVATGAYLETRGWKYVAECPMPEFEQPLEKTAMSQFTPSAMDEIGNLREHLADVVRQQLSDLDPGVISLLHQKTDEFIEGIKNVLDPKDVAMRYKVTPDPKGVGCVDLRIELHHPDLVRRARAMMDPEYMAVCEQIQKGEFITESQRGVIQRHLNPAVTIVFHAQGSAAVAVETTGEKVV